MPDDGAFAGGGEGGEGGEGGGAGGAATERPGTYEVKGVVYYEGATHPDKLKKDMSCQYWFEEHDEWVDAIVTAVLEVRELVPLVSRRARRVVVVVVSACGLLRDAPTTV